MAILPCQEKVFYLDGDYNDVAYDQSQKNSTNNFDYQEIIYDTMIKELLEKKRNSRQ
jgi:hypothetical protein